MQVTTEPGRIHMLYGHAQRPGRTGARVGDGGLFGKRMNEGANAGSEVVCCGYYSTPRSWGVPLTFLIPLPQIPVA